MTRFALRSSFLVTLFATAVAGCVVIDDGGGSAGGDSGGNGNGNGNGNGDGDGNVDDTGGNNGSGDAPSDAQVGDCRDACDDLQFFTCLTANEHATCFALCEERNATAVDLFNSCVSNTIPDCDEAFPCYENLVDAPPVDTGNGDATCVDACEEWLGAGCEPFEGFPSCAAFCGSLSEGLQLFVVECVEQRDGCTLSEECAFGDGGGEGGGGGEG